MPENILSSVVQPLIMKICPAVRDWLLTKPFYQFQRIIADGFCGDIKQGTISCWGCCTLRGVERKAARVIRGLEKVACQGRIKRVDVAQLREQKNGRTVFESMLWWCKRKEFVGLG